jgi:hypothetical protein
MMTAARVSSAKSFASVARTFLARRLPDFPSFI